MAGRNVSRQRQTETHLPTITLFRNEIDTTGSGLSDQVTIQTEEDSLQASGDDMLHLAQLEARLSEIPDPRQKDEHSPVFYEVRRLAMVISGFGIARRLRIPS